MISATSPKKCIPAICLGVIELGGINKMSTTISVVIPYFNDSPVIERCLKSVFNQTHRPNQIIIVDDCSDDSAVLVEIVANMPNEIDIILHRNDENKNGAYSRNYGVSLASGDYIAFLDGDDYWLEQHLELSLNKALETDADFIYSNVIRESAKGKRKKRIVTNISKLKNKPDVLFMSPPQTSSFFFKKNLYQCVSFDENLRRHQDYQFLLDVILKKKKHVYGDFSNACYCESHRDLKARVNVDSMLEFWSSRQSHFTEKALRKHMLYVYGAGLEHDCDVDEKFRHYKLDEFISREIPYLAIKFIGRGVVSMFFYKLMRKISFLFFKYKAR